MQTGGGVVKWSLVLGNEKGKRRVKEEHGESGSESGVSGESLV
jgi:hypothetical protein